MKFFAAGASWGRTWKKWTTYELAEKNFLKKVILTNVLKFCRAGGMASWPPALGTGLWEQQLSNDVKIISY